MWYAYQSVCVSDAHEALSVASTWKGLSTGSFGLAVSTNFSTGRRTTGGAAGGSATGNLFFADGASGRSRWLEVISGWFSGDVKEGNPAKGGTTIRSPSTQHQHHFTNFSESPTFMIVNGITAKKEHCLVADVPDRDGSGMHLAPCESAVNKMDGAELFRFMDNGSLYTLMGKKCISIVDGNVKNGGTVELQDCDKAAAAGDGRSLWEPMPSSQLKSGRAGDYCLSMGPKDGQPGDTDLLTGGGATFSTSSADESSKGSNGGHLESMVADGQDSTYWASQFDPSGTVYFHVDIGRPTKISQIKIDWEYPPLAFAIETSMDGQHFSGCANMASNDRWSYTMDGHNLEARHVRIAMKATHPTMGKYNTHMLYGIQNLKLTSRGLFPTVQKCAEAAKTPDARDKWFLVEVTEFNPCKNPKMDHPPSNISETDMFAKNSEAALEASLPPATGLPAREMMTASSTY